MSISVHLGGVRMQGSLYPFCDFYWVQWQHKAFMQCLLVFCVSCCVYDSFYDYLSYGKQDHIDTSQLNDIFKVQNCYDVEDYLSFCLWGWPSIFSCTAAGVIFVVNECQQVCYFSLHGEVSFWSLSRHHLSVRITHILCCWSTRGKLIGLSSVDCLFESYSVVVCVSCTTDGNPALFFLSSS